jgi:hypothetical protein
MAKRLGMLGLVAVVLVTGCTAVNVQPSSTVSTLSPAWQNWFRFDYAVDQDPGGKRRVSGYLYNTYGEPMVDIQVLAQALDKSGAVVGQQINWVPPISPMSRTYFEVRNLPPADEYRMSVWSFTIQQREGWL